MHGTEVMIKPFQCFLMCTRSISKSWTEKDLERYTKWVLRSQH